MKRPIFIATIGYIIGIIWGLYFKINIALFYVCIIAIYLLYKRKFILWYCIKRFLIYELYRFFYGKEKYTEKNKIPKSKFKIISFKRYFRYAKLIINQKVILVIAIFSIISNVVISLKEMEYKNIYKLDGNTVNIVGIIESNKIEKENSVKYKIKIIKCESNKLLEKKKIYINIKNSKSANPQYGDIVQITGKYLKPEEQRNYGGVNYQNYLKTQEIYGILNISNIKILDNRKANVIMTMANDISLEIKNKIDKILDKQYAEILKGILLGDSSNIDDNIKDNFRNASMSHVLAISGLHISYLIIGFDKLLNRIIGKKSRKYVIIILLVFYLFITGFSPSIIRAAIMSILIIISNIVYRKNDFWTSIAISLFTIIIYNPYLIMNIGLQLSYLGTIGIVIFNKWIKSIFDNLKLQENKYKRNIKKENNIRHTIKEKIKEILSVSISAQITILPIIIYHSNICSPYFIISNFFISIVIGPIIILGFFFIILSYISITLASKISIFLKMGLQILIFISNIGNLPYSKIFVITPNWICIAFFYLFLIILKYIYFTYKDNFINITQKRIKNLIELFKYKFRLNRKKVIKIFSAVVIMFFILEQVPKDLKIYFVDVGQGDCTFIITPENKTILIDGGGSELGNYDVGENILIPYILDRGYTKIDYIIISHFDSDHIGRHIKSNGRIRGWKSDNL